ASSKVSSGGGGRFLPKLGFPCGNGILLFYNVAPQTQIFFHRASLLIPSANASEPTTSTSAEAAVESGDRDRVDRLPLLFQSFDGRIHVQQRERKDFGVRRKRYFYGDEFRYRHCFCANWLFCV